MKYEGAALRHLALPLGGIGTGTVALGGEGGLRQWQIFNQINHRAFVPDSFFALHAGSERPPRDYLRILQSREALTLQRPGTPLVDDDFIPDGQRRLVERFGGVERTVVETAYPFVSVAYEDRELPLEVTLEAFSPFAPFDAEASGIPAAVFAFSLRNRSEESVHGEIAATLQNAVGWDGVTQIAGTRSALYGGNVNRLERRADRVALVLGNPSLEPGAGQMALARSPARRAPSSAGATPRSSSPSCSPSASSSPRRAGRAVSDRPPGLARARADRPGTPGSRCRSASSPARGSRRASCSPGTSRGAA